MSTTATQTTTRMQLTDARVRRLPVPKTGQAFVWDDEVKRLGVQISPKGKKTYVVAGKVNKKTRRKALGPCELFSIEEAREEALEMLREMRNGIDPKEAKRIDSAKNITLGEAFEDYLSNNDLRKETKIGYRRALTATFSDWKDIPVEFQAVQPMTTKAAHQL